MASQLANSHPACLATELSRLKLLNDRPFAHPVHSN